MDRKAEMNKKQFYKDVGRLANVLPPHISEEFLKKDTDDLIEIVLDLGRIPEVRHSDGKIEYLGEKKVTQEDICQITDKIEDFTSDNRSGIPGTLHRISAIKNRKGQTIGLTCRIGRVVTGTIVCIKDLVVLNKSILFLGRPGVGKTTKLREISRLMAEEIQKRVVVVDTSNEIAGDGDIPHPAIGSARRMQVSSPEKQKDIMIEAVQNHTPEVIVVDEIGTEEEAMAARTIAERGVMLIATAHGNTLENLIKNPTLSDLVGGINSVTLSDDEARRRATQKTVLEREKQPTFDIVIEIRDRNTLAVYKNSAEAVDYILRDWPVKPEIRKIDGSGEAVEIQEAVEPTFEEKLKGDKNIAQYVDNVKKFRKVYVYAVSRQITEKAIERLELNAEVTRNIDEADIVIAHKSYSKGGAKVLNVAQNFHIPIHFIKSNSMPQVQKVLKEALQYGKMEGDAVAREYLDETAIALDEAHAAVKKVLDGSCDVELKPQKQHIRKLQHELVEQHNLSSVSIGKDPNRRLKIVFDDISNVG
ncbi:MAG: AAA family ATPase [Candidatus Gastranaerophilales bacterium]|nr:AAA family ATPase [Candidatus Gastranaerophilales bacterium]